MTTYVVESDAYAGWGSAGRSFLYAGLVAGAIALVGWAGMHGHLYDRDSADQLFFAAMAWIGGGVFVVMGTAVLGSIIISTRSRGTVTITDEGVLRKTGTASRILEWKEIQGFVTMPYGGVTLVSHKDNRQIFIPNSLDDYRGCIAEFKAKNIESLPSSYLQQKRRWWHRMGRFICAFSFIVAFTARNSHTARLIGLCIGTATFVWLFIEDSQVKNRGWLRWAIFAIFMGALLWAVHLGV